jgi:hypothetical protein
VIVLVVLAWVVVPIALSVYFVRALLRLRRPIDASEDPHWYLWPFSTADDAIGQLLLVIGTALAGIGIELTLRHFGAAAHPSYVLLGLTLAAAALAWWQRAPLVVFGSVAMSFGWWAVATQGWTGDAESPTALAMGIGVVVLAIIAIGVARLLGLAPRNKRLAFFAWLPGIAALLSALFVLSSQGGMALVASKDVLSPFSGSWKLGVSLGALFAIAAASLALAALRKAASLAESAALGVVLAVMLLVAIVPPRGTASGGAYTIFDGGGTTLTGAGNVWAALFNLLLLAALLGLVFLGYQRREDWMVTFGAMLLFVFVLFKYFDWLFSLLDRSIAFVGAGLLFLVVGWLMERGRRSIIAAMEAEHGPA